MALAGIILTIQSTAIKAFVAKSDIFESWSKDLIARPMFRAWLYR
jgi:hypothetical protein